MPRKRITESKIQAPVEIAPSTFCWLQGIYHFHIFHYRMPQTAAIAAVTSFVPSPLTIKFAMVASLLQMGKNREAEMLTRFLPQIIVSIIPPEAAFSFKAFLRYRSVPAVESEVNLDDTGSYYPSRPHTREYALFEGDLTIFVRIPKSIKDVVIHALKNIRYLGCKDSLTSCRNVKEIEKCPANLIAQPFSDKFAGLVVLLADLKQEASIKKLRDIIPSQRKDNDYEQKLFILPGEVSSKGRTRIFKRIQMSAK